MPNIIYTREMFEESEQIGDEKEIIGEETISKEEMSGLFGDSGLDKKQGCLGSTIA
uniref:Benenodin family lasso peptide n=1 Tax=Meloidogyne incognita TaxID=6306 RepID=A0A914M6S6_MELIC